LVPDVLVGYYEQLESVRLRGRKEIAVRQLLPAECGRVGDVMSRKKPSERRRGVLIEEDFQAG
jgi:hypothetical protein